MKSIRMVLLLTLVCGLFYPLSITALAQLLFPWQANGSLIEANGKVAGSALVGQANEDPRYFWPRPSATAESPYNAKISSGSNLGPTNPMRDELYRERKAKLLRANPNIGPPVPADLYMASGSGLDPHISPEAARFQMWRVANARGMAPEQVEALVRAHTQGRQFGILGEPVVNVLLLNRALDQQ